MISASYFVNASKREIGRKKNNIILMKFSILFCQLLIGNKTKNGNQHRINIPTTIPKVFAEKQRNKRNKD